MKKATVNGPEASTLHMVLSLDVDKVHRAIPGSHAYQANEADIIDVFAVGIETESVGVVRMRNAVRGALVKLGKDIQGDDVYHHGRRMYAEGLCQNAAHIASMVSMKTESTHAGHQRQHVDRSESSYEDDRHIKHMLQMRLGGGSNQALSDIVKEVEDFILTCEQMKTFKGRLRAFIIQKETSRRTQQAIGKVSSLPEIVDRWFPKWLDLLWEPPIPPGAERIRWTCPEVLEYLKAMLRDPGPEPGTTPANHGQTSLPLHWPTSVASAIGSIEVDFSKYASIHKHITSCPRDSRDRCQCWPPLDLLSNAHLYRTVTGETAKSFAMGPNYMAHSFQDPSHIDPLQRLVVRCIPMKMHTALRAQPDDLGLGWGIYFEESWHFKTISIVLSVLMLITSIVFGVTWSVVKSDIQGRFGVASYWATAATFILMVFGALATKQSF
ncbi:hypothetical protein CKAH01_14489 [Colletotrichum kahawae]|uniref:Uncharacterized protein n=1 Tax=Colletotrichum kahawae TaxID=34407 RepID=A0AAE0D9M8_COLKA|nr:hypothetical protein CKAH01_14489 [Colletotrichum kahawae]